MRVWTEADSVLADAVADLERLAGIAEDEPRAVKELVDLAETINVVLWGDRNPEDYQEKL